MAPAPAPTGNRPSAFSSPQIPSLGRTALAHDLRLLAGKRPKVLLRPTLSTLRTRFPRCHDESVKRGRRNGRRRRMQEQEARSMASEDLVAAVGAATFGVGILFSVILVIAAGVRAEGTWPGGGRRSRCGIRQINGVGLPTGAALRAGEAGGRPSGTGRPAAATPDDHNAEILCPTFQCSVSRCNGPMGRPSADAGGHDGP